MVGPCIDFDPIGIGKLNCTDIFDATSSFFGVSHLDQLVGLE